LLAFCKPTTSANAPGMLTIDGNVVREQGSVMEIEIAETALASSLLKVVGDAGIAGALKLVFVTASRRSWAACSSSSTSAAR
jgi:hypothetical protein